MAGDEKYTFSYLAPLPSYDEAVSSRPSSSTSHRGPHEISDDAERQGLLNNNDHHSHQRDANTSNYAPPTVESPRSSVDSLDGLGSDHGRGSTSLRREMQEMDMEDPLSSSSSSSTSSNLSDRFKRLTSFTSSLPSLPNIRRFLPSWKFKAPSIDWQSLDNNRAVILGRLVGIFIIGGLLYVLLASDIIGISSKRNVFMFKPEVIRQFVMESIAQSEHIPEYMKRITLSPHLAGTKGDYELGMWVEEEFKAGGLTDVRMERFDVYMNWPKKGGRRVAIVEDDGKKTIWEAQIEEDREDDYVFYAGSASADVAAPLVYVNRGMDEDYKELQDLGITTQGAIVLIRYRPGDHDRGTKVKRAEVAGAKGCLLYADDFDSAKEGSKEPMGQRLPADGVQRGSLMLWNWALGDVLSPGWDSSPGPQNDNKLQPEKSEALVKIPALPLSWTSAEHLLNALKGKGKKISTRSAGDPAIPEYWTGANGPDALKVNLKNLQDVERKQPIYNIIGKIDGLEQRSKRIIVGNHRDAWCTGASDPGSGTAVMLEVIRVFGELQREGWGPLRTIEFISWDASEYNLIGSTEHVEARTEELKNDAIAYINLGAVVSGIKFRANGSPILEKPLMRTLAKVNDPTTSESILKGWEESGQALRNPQGRGDFVPFQSIAGVPSIDIRYEGDPVPYGSCYDNFNWLQNVGAGSSWERHKSLATVLALLIVELSDHALIPLDLAAYNKALTTYIDVLEKDQNPAVNASASNHPLNLQPLRAAHGSLSRMSDVYTAFDNEWHAQIYSTGGYETSYLGLKRVERNEKIEHFEKLFLNDKGLPDRTQFKHVLFGPTKWDPESGGVFPGIRDIMWEARREGEGGESWKKAQREVDDIARILQEAAEVMA